MGMLSAFGSLHRREWAGHRVTDRDRSSGRESEGVGRGRDGTAERRTVANKLKRGRGRDGMGKWRAGLRVCVCMYEGGR